MSALPCSSSIQRVCVHARGALVTRRVTLEALPDGPCEIVVEGVTPQAEPGSFRVEVLGGRQVTGLLVSRQEASLSRDTSASEALRDELNARLAALDLLGTQLQHERELLRSTSPELNLGRKEEAPAARIQDGLAAGEVLHELLATADARLIELTRERRGIERELADVQAKISQRPPRTGATSAVTISLGPELSPIDELTLIYVVHAARWWPAYCVRLAAGGREGTWAVNAVLAQETDEDWTGVQLALSTADLVTDARLPELPARRLGRAQPPKAKGYRAAPEGLSALFEGYETALSRAARSHVTATGPVAAAPPEPTRHFDVILDDSDASGAVFMSQEDEEDDLFASDEELSEWEVGEGAPEFGAAPANAMLGGMAFEDKKAKPASKDMMMSLTRSGAAAPMPKSARRSKKRGGGPGGGGGGLALPPPPPLPELPLEPADGWLDFDRLSMQGRGSSRGQLGRLQKASSGLGGDARARQAVASLNGPAHARDPQSERGSFDFQFEADGLADVSSGPGLTRVGVSEVPVTVKQVLSVVPSIDDTIYREAELENPLEMPLLGGPIEVYLDGSLLTTTALSKVGRGGVVRFGLGSEDRVRIARNARVREETSGLIGKTVSVEHVVTLELRSSLQSPVSIRVVDRVPVKGEGESDLSVKLLGSQPPAKPYTQAERGQRIEGGLVWELELAAGERKELSFIYVVELPAKREVVGGNRRD
ncbi:MAG: DUF4139 domain-containing protein [Planctomycetes bacterium]|nr:DUF4139 domain-containing protein [Planctomycetota bacterium]